MTIADLHILDAAHLLPGPRLLNILSSSIASRQPESASQQPSTSSMLRNLTHITAPTLPHLLALLGQKDSTFPTVGTALIIIDSLSTLINSAFPKSNNSTSTPRKSVVGASQSLSSFLYSLQSPIKGQPIKSISTDHIHRSPTQ